MKYQTINAGDHFGRLETLARIIGVSYATIKYRANHNLPLINVMSKTGKFDISKKRDSKKCHS